VPYYMVSKNESTRFSGQATLGWWGAGKSNFLNGVGVGRHKDINPEDWGKKNPRFAGNPLQKGRGRGNRVYKRVSTLTFI